MRSRRPLLVLAAAAAGAAALLGWVAWTGGDERLEPPRGGPVEARASLSARSVAPGDAVEAVLDLVVDTDAVEPGALELIVRFDPLTRSPLVRVEEAESGSILRRTYAYTLRCVDRPCVLSGPRERLELPAAVVRHPGEELAVPWPAISLLSRVPAPLEDFPEARAGPPPAPAVGWARGSLLAWLLAGAAALATLAGGTALARALRPPGRRSVELLETPPAGGPAASLEAAVQAIREAPAAAEPDRRLALEALARALEQDGRAELVAEARRLAWSRAAPAAAAVDDLLAGLAAEEHG